MTERFNFLEHQSNRINIHDHRAAGKKNSGHPRSITSIKMSWQKIINQLIEQKILFQARADP